MNVSHWFISKVTPWEHFKQNALLKCEVKLIMNILKKILKRGSMLFSQHKHVLANDFGTSTFTFN